MTNSEDKRDSSRTLFSRVNVWDKRIFQTLNVCVEFTFDMSACTQANCGIYLNRNEIQYNIIWLRRTITVEGFIEDLGTHEVNW